MSNCSMLDDATAAGEAMRMIHELRPRDAVKAGKNTFFVDKNVFPQVLSVVETRAKGLGIKVVVGDYKEVLSAGFDPECYGALLQYRYVTTPHSAKPHTRPECSWQHTATSSPSLS